VRKIGTRRAAALLALAAAGAGPGGPAEEGRFRNFITRSGGKLMDGEREFRFLGANMPGLVLPYDFTLRLPERMRLPTAWEQEDAFKTLDQMNLRAVRLWNLPIRGPREEARPWHYVLGPGEFQEEAFAALDRVLALANRYGVRVIVDFTAGYGDYLGGVGTYAAHREKRRAEFFTDPQIREDFKATLRYVVGRRNRVSGVPYREDKAILAWQFGNEIQEAPEAWLEEMAAFLKSLDPNHLVMDPRHQKVPDPGKVDPNIDIYTRHYYDSFGRGDPASSLRRDLEALGGRRPFIVGEYGPYIGNPAEAETVLRNHRRFLDAVLDGGASGAMLWSLYFHREEGGFYWHQIFTYPSVWSFHWPGFASADAQKEREILSDLRAAAFRIQGRPLEPVPVPEPPEMIFPGDAALLSWRGSAGASGYDLERAPAKDGPWRRIAADVSDADVAYRPLFNDASVRAGETWFYRAVARNGSGASKPSNVVGPVRIRTAWQVDEFMDFSGVQARSEGLSLTNAFNAMYAEYLFRAKGSAGDWIVYRTPAEMTAFRACFWFPGEPVDPTFRVSPDGSRYSDLSPRRRQQAFPSPPGGAARGGRRTLVEFEGTVPPGNVFLKILWNGPAEVDRVEIAHPGGPEKGGGGR